jgi:hypothetical protein
MDVCSLLYRLVFKGNKRNPSLEVKQLKCTAGNFTSIKCEVLDVEFYLLFAKVPS